MGTASHQAIVAAFCKRYGMFPFAAARAPGRVNLIGEHIDYEGYGVLPMAINQACYVAIGWRKQQQQRSTANKSSFTSSSSASQTRQIRRVLISNVQAEVYPPGEFGLDHTVAVPASCPGWLKYVHAAFKGAAEFCVAEGHQIPDKSDVQMMVHSAIPCGSGLSSSSALVVSSALALLTLWGIPASQQQLADFTCRCERYVGTQGGGMDQAVSVMAQPGLALHVEFDPLRCSPVILPPGGVFVVANCLAPSLKAETASSRFNRRVLECHLAAMMLAKQSTRHAGQHSNSSTHDGCPMLDWRVIRVLKQVEPTLLLTMPDTAGHHHQQEQHSVKDTGQLTQTVRQLLPQPSYTIAQVCECLSCSEAELLSLLSQPLQEAAATGDDLHLQQRALHVLLESERVLQFTAICGDNRLSPSTKLSQLGDLMDASHASCAGLYQCSCDELDTLVKVAKEAGALGARLTGAGWGGCVVALVHELQADAFVEALQQSYYSDRLSEQASIRQCLFIAVPSAGAKVELTRS